MIAHNIRDKAKLFIDYYFECFSWFEKCLKILHFANAEMQPNVGNAKCFLCKSQHFLPISQWSRTWSPNTLKFTSHMRILCLIVLIQSVLYMRVLKREGSQILTCAPSSIPLLPEPLKYFLLLFHESLIVTLPPKAFVYTCVCMNFFHSTLRFHINGTG